jgi:hypothetical protein
MLGVSFYYLRNNSTIFEELEVSMWIWRSQMQFYWRREAEPVKRIFATIKSTIDTDNSSYTVLLFLFLWNFPIKSTIEAVKF